MTTNQYSTVQKLSLAGMVIGSMLCLVGACAPYWIVSDPQGPSGLTGLVTKLASKLVKGYVGLYMYCIEIVGVKEECGLINAPDDDPSLTGISDIETDDGDGSIGWFRVSQTSGAACVLLGGVCGLISLCLACCNCCKRFIVLGILAFIAAVCGAASAIIFHKNTDILTTSIAGFQLTSYGWAFYIFCAGVATLGIVSFSSCFSAPENPIRGMIVSHAPAIMVSNSSHQTHSNMPYYHLQEPSHQVGMVNTPTAEPGVGVVTTNGY